MIKASSTTYHPVCSPPQPFPHPHQRLAQPVIPPLRLPPLRLLRVEPNPPNPVIGTRFDDLPVPRRQQHLRLDPGSD